MSRGFESSFGGDNSRIDPTARMECGVCWWVYEPDRGDEEWQVPPGTPFSRLPSHWRCPRCDTPPGQFMVLKQQYLPDRAETPDAATLVTDARQLSEDITRAYRDATTRMRALPVYNEHIDMAFVGPRRCSEGWVGVAVTPWCMNLVLATDELSPRSEGSQRDVTFASGTYRFTVAHLAGMRTVETCSLFSPMTVFEDSEAAAAVAREALKALLSPVDETPSHRRPEAMTRRQLLRGRREMSIG